MVVALGEDRTFGINAVESALKFLLVFLKLAFPDFNLDNTEHLQASTMTGGGMIEDERIAKYDERLKQRLGIHTVRRMACALIANAWNASTLS